MSTTVSGVPAGRTTVTDYSLLDAAGEPTVHHFDADDDGTVDVGTAERVDILTRVYPEAVVKATAPPKVKSPARPGAK